MIFLRLAQSIGPLFGCARRLQSEKKQALWFLDNVLAFDPASARLLLTVAGQSFGVVCWRCFGWSDS